MTRRRLRKVLMLLPRSNPKPKAPPEIRYQTEFPGLELTPSGNPCSPIDKERATAILKQRVAIQKKKTVAGVGLNPTTSPAAKVNSRGTLKGPIQRLPAAATVLIQSPLFQSDIAPIAVIQPRGFMHSRL